MSKDELRETVLQIVARIEAFEREHADWAKLQPRERADDARLADLTNSEELVVETYISMVRFKRQLREMAENCRDEFPKDREEMMRTAKLLEESSASFDGSSEESRERAIDLMARYRLDFVRAIGEKEIELVYDPSSASIHESNAWRKNRDLLSDNRVITEFAERTYLGELNFDSREILSFDDYRFYILHRYFHDMKRTLGRVKGEEEKETLSREQLVPFDLLFSPRMELHYSPTTLAWLSQRDELLSRISGTITRILNRVAATREEIRKRIDQAYVRSIELEREAVRAREERARRDEQRRARLARLEHTTKVPAKREALRRETWQEEDLKRRTMEIRASIGALEATNAFLGDFDRIASRYRDAEGRYLTELLKILNVPLRIERYDESAIVVKQENVRQTLPNEALPEFLRKDTAKRKQLSSLDEAFARYRDLWQEYLNFVRVLQLNPNTDRITHETLNKSGTLVTRKNILKK